MLKELKMNIIKESKTNNEGLIKVMSSNTHNGSYINMILTGGLAIYLSVLPSLSTNIPLKNICYMEDQKSNIDKYDINMKSFTIDGNNINNKKNVINIDEVTYHTVINLNDSSYNNHMFNIIKGDFNNMDNDDSDKIYDNVLVLNENEEFNFIYDTNEYEKDYYVDLPEEEIIKECECILEDDDDEFEVLWEA